VDWMDTRHDISFNQLLIRALSAHSAAEFNILPGRWQHIWLVAIVPPKRWGEMDRNDCHTAWGNFKRLHFFTTLL
jgi:hypothetical protein